MRQSWSPGAKPLCPTDNVTASLASYKTTFYLQNLHDLAILFFLTNITKLAILFYLQKLPGLETNFWATRPRPQRFETKTGAKQPRPRPRPQKIGLETYSPVKKFLDSPVGRAVMRSSLEREVWGSNLESVKSDTVVPTAHRRCDIFSKGAVLPGRNDAEMGPANALYASAYYSEYDEGFDLIQEVSRLIDVIYLGFAIAREVMYCLDYWYACLFEHWSC